jgi:hypothetical protein
MSLDLVRDLSCPRSKSVGKGCAYLFRPMYAAANMGHPSDFLQISMRRVFARGYSSPQKGI